MSIDLGRPLPMLPASLTFTGDVSPCQANACTACCHDTEMPLLPEDVARLQSATGQAVASFSHIDPETGERQLKNKAGACVFLGPNGCTVYAARPAGCRLYPLVHDEAQGRGVLDEDCPYGAGFRIRARDRTALRRLVGALSGP